MVEITSYGLFYILGGIHIKMLLLCFPFLDPQEFYS